MSTFKINLYCNDSLLPSTSDKNTSKFTEWVYDGSGSVNLYVNQRSLDVLQDVSGRVGTPGVVASHAVYIAKRPRELTVKTSTAFGLCL